MNDKRHIVEETQEKLPDQDRLLEVIKVQTEIAQLTQIDPRNIA